MTDDRNRFGRVGRVGTKSLFVLHAHAHCEINSPLPSNPSNPSVRGSGHEKPGTTHKDLRRLVADRPAKTGRVPTSGIRVAECELPVQFLERESVITPPEALVASLHAETIDTLAVAPPASAADIGSWQIRERARKAFIADGGLRLRTPDNSAAGRQRLSRLRKQLAAQGLIAVTEVGRTSLRVRLTVAGLAYASDATGIVTPDVVRTTTEAMDAADGITPPESKVDGTNSGELIPAAATSTPGDLGAAAVWRVCRPSCPAASILKES